MVSCDDRQSQIPKEKHQRVDRMGPIGRPTVTCNNEEFVLFRYFVNSNVRIRSDHLGFGFREYSFLNSKSPMARDSARLPNRPSVSHFLG